MEENRIIQISEKLSQAFRIKAELIQRNNVAFPLLKSKLLRQRMEGTQILLDNIKREEKLHLTLKEGSSNTLMLLDEFKNSPEYKIVGNETKKIIDALTIISTTYLEQSEKSIERRIINEQKYLKEENLVSEKFYLYNTKRYWKKELLMYANILDASKNVDVQAALNFWENICSIATSIPASTKELYVKIKSTPKDILKREFLVAFRDNNILPLLVASPLAAAYLHLSLQMDDWEKATTTYLVWAISGFMTRVIHVIFAFRNICNIAETIYTAKQIREMAPKNIFKEEKLDSQT